MTIEYLAPLGRAVERMRSALFRPFDFGKWFAVGFAAWLAGLGEGGGGGAGGNWATRGNMDELRSSARSAQDTIQDALSSPLVVILLVFVAFILVALAIAIQWVSSRGKFVFLDNVARNGQAIVEPWRRTRVQGNSLFLWRIGFNLLSLAIAVPFLVALWFTIASPFLEGEAPRIAAAIGAVLIWIAIMIPFAFVKHWLDNFVVPIMHRHGLRTNAAWGRFLSLLASRPLEFLGFAFITAAAWFVISLAILFLGCATCCCGFLILAVPYLGTVALLPVLYADRAWGPEFLAQFGPEWTLWPEPSPPLEATQPQSP